MSKRPSTGVTFKAVREMAAALPEVGDGTSYGTPAIFRGDVLMVRHRSEEDADSIAVRVDMDVRDEMIAAEPKIYSLTDHYLNYPWILVRLSRINPDAMRDLLRGAWTLAAKKTRKRARLRNRR